MPVVAKWIWANRDEWDIAQAVIYVLKNRLTDNEPFAATLLANHFNTLPTDTSTGTDSGRPHGAYELDCS